MPKSNPNVRMLYLGDAAPKLDHMAKESGRSRSEIVRRLIERLYAGEIMLRL